MADKSGYSRYSGPRDRQLRVGNAERDAVVEILRNEHVAGRLDHNEFDERLGRCLSAKTYADLDALIADFPGAELERRQPRHVVAWGPRPWPLMFVPLIAVAIVFTHGGAAWLFVPFFFFFFVVRPFVWGYGWRSSAWRGPISRDYRRRY
jgi:Domain of unknown function (DUF1707)